MNEISYTVSQMGPATFNVMENNGDEYKPSCRVVAVCRGNNSRYDAEMIVNGLIALETVKAQAITIDVLSSVINANPFRRFMHWLTLKFYKVRGAK